MTLMEYEQFKNILNKEIFEESKADLIRKIATNPERYIGLFRPTKPIGKLLQNLLQSHEIRFGGAFEVVIEEYIRIFGGEILDNGFETEEGDSLDVDQIFRFNGKIHFIEQKVRDDHDSTKKRGQIQNFERKLAEIFKTYKEEDLVGIFYFIDPDFKKNKNYYRSKMESLKNDYGVDLNLFYGQELFDFLGHGSAWNEILGYLPRWKAEIPDLPVINFDLDADATFREIRDLNPSFFREILSDDKIFSEIVLTIFPDNVTLKKLLEYYQIKAGSSSIYRTLVSLLSRRIS